MGAPKGPFKCPKCRSTTWGDLAHCPNCGEALFAECPGCGKSWRYMYQYKCCPACGERVDAKAAKG